MSSVHIPLTSITDNIYTLLQKHGGSPLNEDLIDLDFLKQLINKPITQQLADYSQITMRSWVSSEFPEVTGEKIVYSFSKRAIIHDCLVKSIESFIASKDPQASNRVACPFEDFIDDSWPLCAKVINNDGDLYEAVYEILNGLEESLWSADSNPWSEYTIVLTSPVEQKYDVYGAFLGAIAVIEGKDKRILAYERYLCPKSSKIEDLVALTCSRVEEFVEVNNIKDADVNARTSMQMARACINECVLSIDKKEALPPSTVILSAMETYDVSEAELLRLSGWSVGKLDDILDDKISIFGKDAEALARVFVDCPALNSANSWLRLQAKCDAAPKRKNVKVNPLLRRRQSVELMTRSVQETSVRILTEYFKAGDHESFVFREIVYPTHTLITALAEFKENADKRIWLLDEDVHQWGDCFIDRDSLDIKVMDSKVAIVGDVQRERVINEVTGEKAIEPVFLNVGSVVFEILPKKSAVGNVAEIASVFLDFTKEESKRKAKSKSTSKVTRF